MIKNIKKYLKNKFLKSVVYLHLTSIHLKLCFLYKEMLKKVAPGLDNEVYEMRL